LFYKPRDYEAFEEIVEETLLTHPMRICGFCLMPNHWHLVLWPGTKQRCQDSLICIMLAVIFRGCHDHPEPMKRAGYIMP